MVGLRVGGGTAARVGGPGQKGSELGKNGFHREKFGKCVLRED